QRGLAQACPSHDQAAARPPASARGRFCRPASDSDSYGIAIYRPSCSYNQTFTLFRRCNSSDSWILSGGRMNDAKEYRRNAAECTSLAQEITNTEGKELLLYMAGQWRELAEKADVVTGFDLAVHPQRDPLQ